jgi:hypothetical protein
MRCQRTAALAAVVTIGLSGPAVAASGASHADASTPAASAAPRAQLTQFDCERAVNPASRAVSVQSVMRPLAGTQSMSVRFDLLERLPGSATTQSVVRAGDLGVWLTPSNPTLGQLPGDIWGLTKTVYDLGAPARYRFRVTFRWTGAQGRAVGTEIELSPTCQQLELRPDLVVESITISKDPQRPGVDLYAALIADRGATGAGPFEVLFTPGDSSAPLTRTVDFLAAHRTRALTFAGPLCNAASPPTVTVDATDEINVVSRADAELTAVCPATTTSTATTTTSAATSTSTITTTTTTTTVSADSVAASRLAGRR